MNMSEPSTPSSPSTTRSPAAPAKRVDMYRAPHKMIRFILANLLVEMGRTTFGDEAQAKAVLARLEAALVVCDGHVDHEDKHLRPALAERAPHTIATLDAEHEEHAQHVAELRGLARALAGAETADGREAIGETLYLHFSVFVAETLAHAAYEERVVQPLCERLFTQEELLAIHAAIIRSIPPEEMMLALQAMIPASNLEERLDMLQKVRLAAGEGALAGILHALRAPLGDADVDLLRTRLEVTQ